MNPKIEKLRQERAKNDSRIQSFQTRNKAIDSRIEALENTDIIGMVRENGITPEALARLITKLKTDPAGSDREEG